MNEFILLILLILLVIIYCYKKSLFGATVPPIVYTDPTGKLKTTGTTYADNQLMAFNGYLNNYPDNVIAAFLDPTGSKYDTSTTNNGGKLLTVNLNDALAVSPPGVSRTTGIINSLGQYTSLYSKITSDLAAVPIKSTNTLAGVLPVGLDSATKHAIWQILLNRQSEIVSKLDPLIIKTL